MNFKEFREQLDQLDHVSNVLRHAVEGESTEPRISLTEEVKLRGRHFAYPVIIRYVVFEHFVDFSEWHCKAGLRIEFCEFKKSLRLADTTVEGPCSLQGSTFHDPDKCWFDFRRLRIAGLLDCTNITATAGIAFESSVIDGNVWFDGASLASGLNRIPNPESDKPSLDNPQLAEVQVKWDTEEEKAATVVMQGLAGC